MDPLLANAASSELLNVNTFDYKPSLSQEMIAADLIISHAGAGTCIEALEAGKPLIVIVNDNLMDNHQTELADKLSDDGYLVRGTVTTLTQTLLKLKQTDLKAYPTPDGSIFSSFVDKLMRVS